MSVTDQDFDASSAERIEKAQARERPKVDTSFFRRVLQNEVLKKNKKCVAPTPFLSEDIPSKPDTVEKKPDEIRPIRKKKEPQQYFQPKRGKYAERLNSERLNSAQDAHNLTSNSNTSKLDRRTNDAKKFLEDRNSGESCHSKVTALEDKRGNVKNSRSNFLNNNSIKVPHIDGNLQWDSYESSNLKVAELEADWNSFSNSNSVHSNNKIVEVFQNDGQLSVTVTKKISSVEALSLTITNEISSVKPLSLTDTKEISSAKSPPVSVTKKISNEACYSSTAMSSKDDNLVNDGSEFSPVLSSLDLNGNVPSANYFTQSFSVTQDISSNDDIFASDSNFFIPPPIPAPSVAYEAVEVFEAEPNSTSLSLNLNKDQLPLIEDKLSENQSVLPDKLDHQVCEVTSTVPSQDAQVSENKTTISSEENGVNEVQSSEDDQASDVDLIKEISQFLKELEFKRYMPKIIAENILHDLKNCLRYYFNGNSVKLYGSYWYEAAITTSNINFALVTDQPVKNNFLLHMQKTLSKEMNGYKVFPFEEETNPRRSKICFIDNEHGISCEIIYLGTIVSQHMRLSNMLKAVCNFEPRIKSLVTVVKMWAEACEINETESGKLHSVGFILLVLHYLQQLEKPLLPLLDASSRNWGLNKLPVKNDSSVGELWLGLLNYYGAFNWNEHVVTVTAAAPITKASKMWDVSWIAIEDPISEKNIAETVAASDTAEYITSCFKRSHQYFISAFYDSDSSSSGSVNGSQNIQRSSIFNLSDCISRPPPIFCSDDDSDSEILYAPQRPVFQEPFKYSKISETSLKCVDQVLQETYEEYVLPYNQVKGREAFVKNLEKYISKIYPGAKLKLFGSTVNGFAFKRSDLDICMTLSGKYENNGSGANVLRRLVRHLRKRDDLKNVFALYSAQIPIIKFNFTIQNWHCDLSFYNVLAVHNSKLIHKYSMMDERCRILGCALKLLTKKTCLADCSSKTLSSYSYILMVIHFLQQVNPPVLPVMPIHDKEAFEKEIDEKELERQGVLQDCNYWFSENVDQLRKRYLGDEINTSTVGELWLEMLEYYLKFDYERAVSITEKDPVPTSSLQRYARYINIEDPFISKRNLGCIVSEGKAAETSKVFHRARMLFGNECPCDKVKRFQDHYFSPSNLTGRIVKDIECFGCGGFGHETKDCLKADPFKNRKPWTQFRKRTQKPLITRKP